jgi:hypothetical protein
MKMTERLDRPWTRTYREVLEALDVSTYKGLGASSESPTSEQSVHCKNTEANSTA